MKKKRSNIEVWNDCPVCGQTLYLTGSFDLACNKEDYFIGFRKGQILYESFIIGNFEVFRDSLGTEIIFYDYSGEEQVSLNINFILNFEQFNSEEKIEQLLIYA